MDTAIEEHNQEKFEKNQKLVEKNLQSVISDTKKKKNSFEISL